MKVSLSLRYIVYVRGRVHRFRNERKEFMSLSDYTTILPREFSVSATILSYNDVHVTCILQYSFEGHSVFEKRAFCITFYASVAGRGSGRWDKR